MEQVLIEEKFKHELKSFLNNILIQYPIYLRKPFANITILNINKYI